MAAQSETSSLLGKAIGDETEDRGYGAVQSDPESAPAAVPIEGEERRYSNAFIARTVIALLIGAFTANADGSLVMATHPVIGSEFNDLENSSWLFIGFMLAGSATQSLYGKLSDIFGRKSLILLCYGFFAIGCALVGVGQTLLQVIVGRVISGSGGAGMTVLTALIITDLAPLREVAAWQSYLNIVATTGRSIGGPVGGWLTDTIGWRWSFLGQAPIFASAAVICWIILPSLKQKPIYGAELKLRNQLGRIDFAGAALLGLGIFSLMLPLEIGGSKLAWSHPLIIGLFITGTVLLGTFLVVEEYWAKEPIFPVRLLRNRNVVLVYLISGCQMAAQLTMMFSVPLYFQVTQRTSSTVAGAHLFPAVAGNAIGALAVGQIIKRTGRYKNLIVFATFAGIVCYSLLILRWQGQTNWVESMYIIPGGLGTGMAQSALFVALQASIDPKDRAPATSALFLVGPTGATVGMAIGSALIVRGLRNGLFARLTALGLNPSHIHEIVDAAASNVGFLDRASSDVAKAAVESYIEGIEYSHYVSLACSTVGFVAAVFLRERALRK
ncbi:major facilitator superfamily transporter [Truncatella angustata]|uniref:Major facilitator superfamily transporter n=1 Tax=Truncatella angustata TaxID=152316 RepID=A0A9P8ZSX4_9PEZI|nr:major facilitator superfamily transporter [Truncatella angustata]KAH6648635.1 major facilitator superfamily transporter [Truncatella angustata]